MTVTIDRYCTASPHTVGQEQSLEFALELMKKHRIHHLPVLHGGELVGTLSLRDIEFIAELSHLDKAKIRVEDAMSDPVYTVAPGTPLLEVALYMSEHHIGSTVVTRGREIVGIFTTTDGLRALADALKASA